MDVTIIAGTMQAFDYSQMKLVGSYRLGYRIIVMESGNHFLAWWSGAASATIDSDPSGIGSKDLSTFAFQKNGKLYPVNADAIYKNLSGDGKMENRFYIPVPEDPHLLLGAAGTLARSSVRKRSFGFLFRLRE